MTFKRKLIERALAVTLVMLLVMVTAGAILWQDAQNRVAHASVQLLANQVAAQLSADPSGAEAQLETVVRAAAGERARLLAVTTANLVVADTAGELVGTALALPAGFIGHAAASATGQVPAVERVKLGGQTALVAAVPLRTGGESVPSDVLLLVAVPVGELVGGWLVFLPRLLLAGTLVLAVAVTAIWLVASQLSAPLDDLAASMQALAAGDYEIRMTASGPDEMKQLSAAFNKVVAEVKAGRQVQRNLLVSFSRDLAAPLTSIQEYSRTLMGGAVTSPEQHQRVAETIYAEAERLVRWVQGLPDLVRTEDASGSANGHDLDLNDLLEHCREQLWPRAEAAGVVLQVERPRRPLTVQGEAGQLGQVLTGLVDNALARAGAGGRVAIKATLGGLRSGTTNGHSNGYLGGKKGAVGRWWGEISVTHEGAVEPASVPCLEPLHQPGVLSANSGPGLGLATAREVVAAHGGELVIQERPDAGVEYRLRLPMKVGN